MAEEKRPLESEPQAAPEASTPDVPGAPAPDLSGDISQPVHDGPAQPDPGDVVISFEKIDELLKERRDAAREKVEQESPPEPSAEGGKEEKTKPEPEQPKPRRGRPPKEKAVSEDKDTKAATPRRGRPPKADKAAPDKATPPKPRDKVALLTKSRSASPYQQKKTPSGVIRRVLSSVSGSMRSPTRGSGPPLPLSLVAKRALSCARASARKTSPRTRPAAVSAPPGIPGWNGVPGCAVGLPQSS